MNVERDFLLEHEACEPGLEVFDRLFPSGTMEVTHENLTLLLNETSDGTCYFLWWLMRAAEVSGRDVGCSECSSCAKSADILLEYYHDQFPER